MLRLLALLFYNRSVQNCDSDTRAIRPITKGRNSVSLLVFVICMWLLNIAFAKAQTNNPNDCTGAILLCGNTEIGLTPAGVGFNEWTEPGNNQPPCYSFLNQQIWIQLDFVTSGQFEMDILSDVFNADFDFAIYGPNATCTNLGNAIRCSSTNPAASGFQDTGLNATSTDTSEGPGAAGDGYLQALTVQAGETYYLLIDRAVGEGGFMLEVGGTARLPDGPVVTDIGNQIVCDELTSQDGMSTANLSDYVAMIEAGQPNVVTTFHDTLNDANLGANPLPATIDVTTTPRAVFARTESTTSSCATFLEFSITVQEVGDLGLTNPIDIFACDDAAIITYDTDLIGPQLGLDPAYQFTYYTTQADAIAQTNAVPSNQTLTTAGLNLFVLAQDPLDMLCPVLGQVSLVLDAPPVPLVTDVVRVCDDDFDGSLITDFAFLENELVPAGEPWTVDVYASAADRGNGLNVLSNITLTMPITEVFVRITDPVSDCRTDVDLDIVLDPLPVLDEPEEYFYCENLQAPVEICTTAGFADYQWSTGDNGSNCIMVNAAGDYSVQVVTEQGCMQEQIITVLPSSDATFQEAIIVDFQLRGENEVELIVTGLGDYEYALVQEFIEPVFQPSSLFTEVTSGFNTFIIRDRNGCGAITVEVAVLDYPRFFTPNGDLFNDRWHIEGIELYPDLSIEIFDRHGKLLKVLGSAGIGWDGTYNSFPLPSSDYWFNIVRNSAVVQSGHFTLKR